MAIELNIDDIHAENSESLVNEAREEGLIKTGSYEAIVQTFKFQVNADDSEWAPGRQFANCRLALFSLEEEGKFIGNVFLKVSWQEQRGNTGRLDNQSRLYGLLVRALGIKASTHPAEVLKHAQEKPFKVQVTEKYAVNPDDLLEDDADAFTGNDGRAWVNVNKDEDEKRSHYLDLGYEPFVSVRKIERR